MIAWFALACRAPTIATAELPHAVVGDLYQAAIQIDGRIRGEYRSEGLPEGLSLNPRVGIVSGVPTIPGTFDVTVRVTDRDGAVTDEADFTLTVQASEPGCGLTASGTWPTVTSTTSALDWAADDWRAIPFPMPGDDVEEIRFEVDNVDVFLTHPGRPFVEGVPFRDQAVRIAPVPIPPFEEPPETDARRLGWTTWPNLGPHQAVSPPATLVVVALEEGPWSLTTSCVRGPVLATAIAGPVRLGDTVLGSFRVTKYDEDVVMEALDPLPSGIELDENGIFTGTAEVAGNHVFRVRMTRTTNGRSMEAAVGLGIWAPVPLGCEEAATVTTADLDPAFAALSRFAGNVDRFEVLEVPWADHVGLAFDVLDAVDVDAFGLVDPSRPLVDPWRDAVVELDPLEVGPTSWPPIDYFRGFPRARATFATLTGPASSRIRLSCDDGPRPGPNDPPVLTATPSTVLLSAVGGVPPLRWAASGLPDGVTIDPDGTLHHDGQDFGVVDVRFTITDDVGTVTETNRSLASSTEAFCGPDAVMVTCGDTVDLPRDLAVDPRLVCLEPDDVARFDWVDWRVEASSAIPWDLMPPRRLEGDGDHIRSGSGRLVQARGTRALRSLDLRGGWPVVLRFDDDDALVDPELSVTVTCGDGFPP